MPGSSPESRAAKRDLQDMRLEKYTAQDIKQPGQANVQASTPSNNDITANDARTATVAV